MRQRAGILRASGERPGAFFVRLPPPANFIADAVEMPDERHGVGDAAAGATGMTRFDRFNSFFGDGFF